MSLSFSQSMSFDGHATTYDYSNETTSTDETFATLVISAPAVSTNSCYPTCSISGKPTDVGVAFITKLLSSFAIALVLIITISAIIFLRRHQHSQKQAKEYLPTDKIHAHPFEEILVVVNGPQSIELMELTPTTVTN